MELAKALKLYLVTDRSWLQGNTLEHDVNEAILGGVTFVQIREKNTSPEEFEVLAKRVKKVTDQYKVPLVINDNAQLAKKIDASGVHIGQSDTGVKTARMILGNDKIIGVTCNRVDLAIEAEKSGADYLGVGAVFGTNTKLDAKPLDHRILKSICASVKIPVVAIGGITKENVLQLKSTGIAGVAVVSGILKEADKKAVSTKLNELLDEVL